MIFYFFIIRPQRQQQKKTKRCSPVLRKTTKWLPRPVFTVQVVIVKDKTVVLRVDEGCRIEFDRESIALVRSNEIKPEVVK